MFNTEDLQTIREHGMTAEKVERQIANFRNGFVPLPVIRAASAGDGIIILSDSEVEAYSKLYDSRRDGISVVKFVPASGAATRMFKDLYAFVNEGKRSECIDVLLANLKKFAFYGELKKCRVDFRDEKSIVSAIILEGLGYGSKPKGLVTFHKYGHSRRKAVEEHLIEGAMYGSSNRNVRLHFTVSPEHEGEFIKLLARKAKAAEKKYGVKYEIAFSEQKKSTDTIAVNPDFTPFRTEDGRLMFRPAGHGALINNLDEISADIIFVKNIDNVTTDALRADTIRYKKALAGVLLDTQDKVYAMIRRIDEGGANEADVRSFLTGTLCVETPETISMNRMRAILDRPLRVCGMVRNEGEPGGGPFWARNEDGSAQLQIAESSQIEDKSLMATATHFNPVDLVCAVRRSDGTKFHLPDYVDPSTGFISRKSSGGKDLLAQELPGLWNGAMARWNTLFVEVPITTFSPVKVVTDLLRPQHQPRK